MEQKHELDNGTVVVGENDFHRTVAARSDLAKYSTQIVDVTKYSYDMRMGLAIDLVKCMLSTSSFSEFTKCDGLAYATGTPPEDPAKLVDRAFTISELMFAKGIEKGWMNLLDEGAMQALRDAEAKDGFKGIFPGRD